MTKRGRTRVLAVRRTVAALAVLVAVGAPTVASATTSVTTSTLKCSVTALPPTLVGSGANGLLTGWASVVCTKATSLQAIVGVVELDGTVEDIKVPITPKTISITVKANVAMLVNTGTVKCLDTDLLAKEEYASKAMLNLFGPTSAWDRTTPLNDSYSC